MRGMCRYDSHDQGFIHRDNASIDTATANPDAPLPSLSLSSLRISHPEVANVFHLPLSALASPTRLHTYKFRGTRPYFAVTVSDLVEGVHWSSDPEQRDEIGGGREGRLEVWGLTGWYLSLLMKTLQVYQ